MTVWNYFCFEIMTEITKSVLRTSFFFADSEACLLENQLFGKTMDFDQTSMVLFDGPLFFCFFLIKLVFFLFLLLDGNQERKVHAEFFKRRMILTFFLGKKQLFDRRKNSESMSLFWFCQVLFCRTKKICCFFFLSERGNF